MDLNQLHYFIAVAETENLTKAAQKLFITQPALSRAISRLETELGLKLFDRKAHSLILNSNGQLFLQHVSMALDSLDSGIEALRQLNKKHRLVIANHTFLDNFSSFCDRCLVAFPDLDLVEFDSGKTASDCPGDLVPDLMLTPDRSDPDYLPIREYLEPWCIVYHKDYPFRSDFSGGSISLAQLRQEYVSPGDSSHDRAFIASILGSSALRFSSEGQPGSSRTAVNRCQSLGIIPAGAYLSLLQRVQDTPVRAMRLLDHPLERKIYLTRKFDFSNQGEFLALTALLDKHIQTELETSAAFANSLK